MRIYQIWTTELFFLLFACQSVSVRAQTSEESAKEQSPAPLLGTPRNSREKKIAEALRSPAELSFLQTPMGDVENELVTRYRIPIVLDESCADNNLDKDTLITTELSGLSLGSALRIILGPYQCTWVIGDEVLYLMSKNAATDAQIISLYDCRDLVANMEGEDEGNLEQIINGITAVVEADSWTSGGGRGAFAEVGGLLFVMQSQDNQDQVSTCINMLQRDFVPASAVRAQADDETAEDRPIERINGDTGNERENRIFAALNSDAEFDYFETNMGEVKSHLMAQFPIPIVLDNSAAEHNLDEAALITLQLSNVSLRSGLRIMLHPFQCTYLVKDEALYLVADPVATATPVMRFYDCRNLVQNMDDEDDKNFEQIIHAVTTIIDPESWESNGGSGAIAEVGGILFVTQHQENQDRIENFLNTVNEEFAKP